MVTFHTLIFEHWLAIGAIWRGWVRSASGDAVEGIPWIEQGIRDLRATNAVLGMGLLARKAEALHLADPTSEALEAINEAEALAERFEHRDCRAELHRLRGVFLAAIACASLIASSASDVRSAKCKASAFIPSPIGRPMMAPVAL